MNILLVANNYKPMWESGGVARSVYELSQALNAQGHDVTVYATNSLKKDHGVKTNQPVIVDGVKTYYFENSLKIFRSLIAMPTPFSSIKVARSGIDKFDIVHINDFRSLLAIIVSHYAFKSSIPYVVQARGSAPYHSKKTSLKRVLDMLLVNRMVERASALIALNSLEVDDYLKCGYPAEKILIAPNGINFSEFEELPPIGSFRRKKAEIADKKIVLFIGRISPIKGLEFLIESFVIIKRNVEDAVLVIAGPTESDLDYYLNLKYIVSTYSLDDSVLFLGGVYDDDKKEVLQDADVFVLPSIYDCFPNVVLESLACGTPIVITNNCGLKDELSGLGLVVNRNMEEMVDAILLLLIDKRLNNELGSRGRESVKEKFNWSSIVKIYESIYNDIIIKK